MRSTSRGGDTGKLPSSGCNKRSHNVDTNLVPVMFCFKASSIGCFLRLVWVASPHAHRYVAIYMRLHANDEAVHSERRSSQLKVIGMIYLRCRNYRDTVHRTTSRRFSVS